MAMGNTGTVNVTPEMINNAKDAIQEIGRASCRERV